MLKYIKNFVRVDMNALNEYIYTIFICYMFPYFLHKLKKKLNV